MFDQAWSLEAAQTSSEHYSYNLTTEDYSVSSVAHDSKLSEGGVGSSAQPSGKCYFCGYKINLRSECAARAENCRKCGKTAILKKCRSPPNPNTQKTYTAFDLLHKSTIASIRGFPT